jgi:hypothetical protein
MRARSTDKYNAFIGDNVFLSDKFINGIVVNHIIGDFY